MQSGGHVALYSELAQSTTVKIYLPRAVEARALDRVAPWQPAVAGAGGEIILLVEDDPDVREFTVAALTCLGYRLLEASHGQEALRLLDAHPEIALLFTDVGLPDLNGRQLATEAQRRLRHRKVLFTPATPIMLLSTTVSSTVGSSSSRNHSRQKACRESSSTFCGALRRAPVQCNRSSARGAELDA
jgi:CheY-like chemotaxis protein